MVRQPLRGARKEMLDLRIVTTSVGLLLEQSSNSITCRRDWRETSPTRYGLQHRSLQQREGTHDPPQRIASQPLPSMKSTKSSNKTTNHHCPSCDHLKTLNSNRTPNHILRHPCLQKLCTYSPLPTLTTGLKSAHFAFTGTTVPPKATHPILPTGPTNLPPGSQPAVPPAPSPIHTSPFNSNLE